MHDALAEKPAANPYDVRVEPDRHAFWEALVARDSEAFAAADWSICDGDFCHERFEGISAHGSLNPLDWTLEYPTVNAYRDDWLRMAARFNAQSLVESTHRELLYRMQSFAKIEISGDRALVWKQFLADEPLQRGERYRANGQSLYRLHRLDGQWRIVGFVGYLPLEGAAP
ncbi:MAG: hypothetical protein DCC67_01375 [Planctomycetota bacterium]|nr:MAG: hypothetical protein DCC67_01375 [Planctomycetota bacterium]